MAFPVVPALAAAGIGLLLLMSSSSASAKEGPVEPPGPPPPPPHPNNRPRRPANPPPGFMGWATIKPSCEGEPAKCNNGLLVHSSPNTDPGTLVAPEDASPTSNHALTGDEVAVIDDNVADQSSPKTSRVWAQVMTPMGNVGYVSWIDTQNRGNFTKFVPPDAVTSGMNVGQDIAEPALGFSASPFYQRYGRSAYGQQAARMRGRSQYGRSPYGQQAAQMWGFPAGTFVPATSGVVGTGNRRYVRCTSPSGCHLRTGSPMMPSIVAHGAMLQLLSVAPGGLAYVRHHDPVRGTVDGWISTQFLAG